MRASLWVSLGKQDRGQEQQRCFYTQFILRHSISCAHQRESKSLPWIKSSVHSLRSLGHFRHPNTSPAASPLSALQERRRQGLTCTHRSAQGRLCGVGTGWFRQDLISVCNEPQAGDRTALPPAPPVPAVAVSAVPLPSTSVVLICSISQLWPFSLYEPKMVNMVLFSPGSVSSPYTNTGFSEKVNVFQVSPSFVLYLEKQDWESCQGWSCLPQGTFSQPQPEHQQRSPCPAAYLSWSVSVPCAMATRMPPWSPHV